MSVIFLFQTTRSVIKAESVCRNAGVQCQVLPVPKDISSECGMCLSVNDEEISNIQEALSLVGIAFQTHRFASVKKPSFDLLTTVEFGGCSAKLPPEILAEAVRGYRTGEDPGLLVGIDTCDDAGVFKLTDEIALIETTDFFPPVCSDAFEFGQISAANALSDVYAMGGKVITAMNLVMFPAEGIPLEVLREILAGGADKVREAGGIIVGGHTIVDFPPKYGLSVAGIVHPGKVVTNASARPGEDLVLTKPIGCGTVLAGRRIGETGETEYREAIRWMKVLNRSGAEIMQEFGVRCATDVTGFGLLGHALHIARASRVTLEIMFGGVPLLPGAASLAERGCIPGACFRNLKYVEKETAFDPGLPYSARMLTLDPQTSGGLLMTVDSARSEGIIARLRSAGYTETGMVGKVLPFSGNLLVVRNSLSGG